MPNLRHANDRKRDEPLSRRDPARGWRGRVQRLIEILDNVLCVFDPHANSPVTMSQLGVSSAVIWTHPNEERRSW